MELYPHQLEAVEKLHNGSILYGNVGVGKSLTAAAYYMKRETPKDIYVITTAKKRESLDWEGVFAKYGIGTEITLEGLVKIDSWQNIGNYTEIEDAFFIFDEQRLVGTGAWVKAFQKIARNNNWIMLTATPGDSWLDYAPIFIANGLYRNVSEFKREHVVYAPFTRFPKIIRYDNVDILEKYRNMILVEMPYLSHTERVINYVETQYDYDLFKTAFVKRWNPYESRPIKDISELFRVMRRIVASDPDRLHNLQMLMEKHPKIVVFYNFNYELDILRSLSDEIEIAEWNGHKHEKIPRTDRWLYLVQYTSGAEGWNCTETDTMVFFSLTYSYKNFMQSMGRIDRLDTPFTTLFYYVFVSNSLIDKAVRNSLNNKKMFNERSYSKKLLGNY